MKSDNLQKTKEKKSVCRNIRFFKVHVNPKIHYIFGPVVVKCLLWMSKNCL